MLLALVVLGAVGAVVYPAADLVSGRGLQWSRWFESEWPFLIFYLVGVYVYFRRPEHAVARGLLVVGTFLLLATTAAQVVSVVWTTAGPQPWGWAANAVEQILEYVGLAAIVATFAVFPDGRYQRRYERWVVRLSIGLAVVVPVSLLLTLPVVPVNPLLMWAAPSIESPLRVSGLGGLGTVVRALYVSRLTLFVVAAVLLVLRYRRSDPQVRLQARWPLFSLLFVIPLGMGPFGYLAGVLGVVPMESTVPAAGAIVMPTLPLALVTGLLRPRLLDLPSLIRRTTVYAALWLGIGFGYVAVAAAVGILTAERAQVSIAIFATIVATLAFQPARSALERLSSRLVFGERPSEFEAVSRLGATLDNALAPQRVAQLLATTVRSALNARWVRVTLEGCAAVAVDGESDMTGEATLSTALSSGDDVIGGIECGPRSIGAYRDRHRELLATLGRQAALAEGLRASRARIVQAEEAGRRRLERDIHDGVQQELVALIAKIRLARDRLDQDPGEVAELLIELQDDTRLVLGDLRDLAQGIHPTVLSDRGLVEAVEDRVARMTAPVTLDVAGPVRGARFAPDVEGAAYFTVCEGLANAMKHASARQLSVRLDAADGELSVAIRDDGGGFDPRRVGRSGLRGLEDRIEALGGRMRVLSAPGEGTQLVATLPARAARDA